MHRSLAAALVLPLVLALGCSDAQLTRLPPQEGTAYDNKLTINTSVCLDAPGQVVFPVKILFAIDTSGSMDISDPINPMQPDPTLQTGRSTAVRAVIDRFANQPGVDIAIMAFGAAANVVTNCGASSVPCFIPDTSANQTALYTAVVALNVAAGTTDYEGAMDEAYQVISDDMTSADAVSLARSSYIVIVMSDGLPDPETADYNNPTTIVTAVGDIMNLQTVFGVGLVQVDTALLATGQPAFVQVSEGDVLQSMATRGNGSFRSFPNGESINFLDIGITSLQRAFSLKSFLAVPMTTNLQDGVLLVDSDGDGLPDELEYQIGTDPTNPDTDGDGYSDLLEYRFAASGFDPLDPDDADCSQPGDRDDTDGDGVLDCEERFLGTSKTLVDSDGDGLPDGDELRAGTDPTLPDVIQDTDQDGTYNAIEVPIHTDPLYPDAADRSLVAQRYLRTDVPIPAGATPMQAATPCFDFTIENVSLLQTLPIPIAGKPGMTDGGGWNHIILWSGEVPFDDPSEDGTYKTACVTARYFSNGDKFPASGQLTLPASAWVPAGQTPTCVGP